MALLPGAWDQAKSAGRKAADAAAVEAEGAGAGPPGLAQAPSRRKIPAAQAKRAFIDNLPNLAWLELHADSGGENAPPRERLPSPAAGGGPPPPPAPGFSAPRAGRAPLSAAPPALPA